MNEKNFRSMSDRLELALKMTREIKLTYQAGRDAGGDLGLTPSQALALRCIAADLRATCDILAVTFAAAHDEPPRESLSEQMRRHAKSSSMLCGANRSRGDLT